MKQRGAILPPSKMLSEGMMMFHIHLPCVAGLSVHSSVRHLPRCGTETVVAFYWWMSKETWLEVLPGALYPEIHLLFSLVRCQHHLGAWKPIQYLRHSILCAACFFSSCTSADFFPLPGFPPLHLSHSCTFPPSYLCSLSVSSCSTCDELCSSCISRKAKIAF